MTAKRIPKISIIVPVFNVERYLTQCIQSLLNQTLDELEIILIDDCSTDKSSLICDEYANKYSQIKVIHKEKNEGLGMACNTGLDNANGDFIAFCDSDDYVDSQMYQTMYETAQQYSCDIVFTGIKRISSEGVFLGNLPHYNNFILYKEKKQIYSFLKDIIASAPSIKNDRKIQVSAKTVLYRHEIIKQKHLRFVSERILPSEDLIFNIDILMESNIICSLPQAFYNYRVNLSSISQKIKKDKFILFKNLYKYMTMHYNKGEMDTELQQRIQRMFIGYTRSYLCSIIKAKIPNSEKKQIVNSICKDIIWENIWKNYPIQQMPLTHKIFSWGMKKNSYFILSLLNILKK